MTDLDLFDRSGKSTFHGLDIAFKIGENVFENMGEREER